jgi:hypothetical protein
VPVFPDELSHLGIHSQLEGWVTARLTGKKIQEIALRNQDNKGTTGLEMGKISYRKREIAESRVDPGCFLMRQFQ